MCHSPPQFLQIVYRNAIGETITKLDRLLVVDIEHHITSNPVTFCFSECVSYCAKLRKLTQSRVNFNCCIVICSVIMLMNVRMIYTNTHTHTHTHTHKHRHARTHARTQTHMLDLNKGTFVPCLSLMICTSGRAFITFKIELVQDVQWYASLLLFASHRKYNVNKINGIRCVGSAALIVKEWLQMSMHV